jgi:(p)ppGpp synthase/HD superfamily hydrolase
MSYELKGSKEYKKAKLMAIMSMGGKEYFNHPFKKHIEDIEQTLISYGFKDERLLIALWVANIQREDVPFKARIQMFGRDVVKLAFGFNRTNITRRKDLKDNEKEKLAINKDVITLRLAERIANINYAINNNDSTTFDMYVNSYEDYSDALEIRGLTEHENMWKYLYFTCVETGSINSLFFYM